MANVHVWNGKGVAPRADSSASIVQTLQQQLCQQQPLHEVLWAQLFFSNGAADKPVRHWQATGTVVHSIV